MTIILFIIIMAAWRYYDGRGYRLSEAAGWVLGPVLGALAVAGDASISQMLYGASQGAIAMWCIVRGYNGWDRYMPMLRRSWPAAGILLNGILAVYLGEATSPSFILVAAMCVIANVSQVPLRRHQKAIEAWPTQPRYGKYMAEICETYEAAWIGAAIAMLGAVS